MAEKKNSRFRWMPLTGALLAGIAIALVGNHYYEWSSTDEACMSCHFHPEATDTKKLTDEQRESVQKLIDRIEEDEDVQNVFTNMAD